MAGKKKQPPKPPAPPVQPAKPVAPPQPAGPAEVKAAAPAAAPAPATAAPVSRPAAVNPGPAHDNHGTPRPKAASTKAASSPKRLPGLPAKVPLLDIDWDELPTIDMQRLPYWTMPAAYALIIFSFILLAMGYVARNTTHTVNRLNIIPDMDNEPRWKSQQANYMFADHRASRPWPEGTVARGMLETDDHYFRGIVAGQWATALPPQVTVDQALLDRGQNRFNIYCSPCHGEAGYGDGMVAKHADQLKEGTWTTPLNYHTEQVRSRPVGHLFNTITNGIRTMPPYGSQIPVADRWAIVAWIRVLQASQGADLKSLPLDKQQELLSRKPKVDAAPAATPAAETPLNSVAGTPAPGGSTPPPTGDTQPDSNAPPAQASGQGTAPAQPPAGGTAPPAPANPPAPTTPPAQPQTPPQGSSK